MQDALSKFLASLPACVKATLPGRNSARSVNVKEAVKQKGVFCPKSMYSPLREIEIKMNIQADNYLHRRR
jgi:hypothetical protein